MYEGDSEMDRCHRHPEESWYSPRDCQGINKVWTKNFFQQTSWLQLRSESWVFSMYNGECYDLISQLANLGMRKLISEDSYHQVWIFHFWWWWKWGILCWNIKVINQDIDLLLKRSKNVPKKTSFLKRDLDARKDSEAYRWMGSSKYCHIL